MSSDKFQPTWATKSKLAAPKPPSPDAKPQQYGDGARPMLYRPQRASSPRRRRRGCSCLLFTTLFLVILLVLAAITAAILYAVYRPHRPTFSISSLHVAALNFSSATVFSSCLSLSISTRNPNSKIAFSYDPLVVSVFSPSSSVQIAAERIPAFVHPIKNTTHLAATVTSKGLRVRNSEISALKSAVKRERGMDLETQIETKVRIRVGKSRSKKIAVKVSCIGIKAATDSKDKFSGSIKTGGVKCKAKLRFKIWKWDLSW